MLKQQGVVNIHVSVPCAETCACLYSVTISTLNDALQCEGSLSGCGTDEQEGDCSAKLFYPWSTTPSLRESVHGTLH